jgi:hypothetical protein
MDSAIGIIIDVLGSRRTHVGRKGGSTKLTGNMREFRYTGTSNVVKPTAPKVYSPSGRLLAGSVGAVDTFLAPVTGCTVINLDFNFNIT